MRGPKESLHTPACWRLAWIPKLQHTNQASASCTDAKDVNPKRDNVIILLLF